MKYTQMRWVEPIKVDADKVSSLSKALTITKVLSSLLIMRGINSYDEAKLFFRPEIQHLHDPFLMKDMDTAISRIEGAILNNEKILIYGDYDVDGTTAVALVFDFFRQIHSNIAFYVPDRHQEGYGISTAGIDWAIENGYSLIIALDCGIKAIDRIEYANEHGIDFIIGDHHMPGESLPNAVAVLDPKRNDCQYPYNELSGCGIGFKIVQAYAQKNHLPASSYHQYLDLVAVSIAADVVPLTGENRVLTFYGLRKLNTNPCFGLAALIDLIGKKDTFSTEDILFQIGPRINAAGRIEHAKNAVHLLLSRSQKKANEFCVAIDLQNTERKDHDRNITEQALAMIENSEDLIGRKTTVVYHKNWHKGVIGIVASRLTEKYYRPTIVLTHSKGVVTGSARSVTGFDLYTALNACSDLLDQFGGHKYAAGLTMKEQNVPALQKRFEEIVSATISPELLIREIHIDYQLHLSEIDARFFRIMKQFGPFGPSNHAPIFISKGIKVVGQATIVGEKHLRLAVSQDNSAIFGCIGFGMAQYFSLIEPNVLFDICYCIEENSWRNNKSIQLNLKGIRIATT